MPNHKNLTPRVLALWKKLDASYARAGPMTATSARLIPKA